MIIDKETVQSIAHLARLHLNENEEKSMMSDLNKIIGWMDKLNELDTEDIAPLISMSDNKNIMREDVTKEHISHYDALKNAPRKDSDYVRVPKVIE